ncbi:5621_t:CDS:2 [Ambispora leptoticha]|uniref:5621_t:CDS:1 n=1 Tax=Ambispora leptoticha TaxID=144679 RepID=A0A9N8Z688_9GLOM|nr:5621_t:CDS:2 [Ambispora leptoticha]
MATLCNNSERWLVYVPEEQLPVKPYREVIDSHLNGFASDISSLAISALISILFTAGTQRTDGLKIFHARTASNEFCCYSSPIVM